MKKHRLKEVFNLHRVEQTEGGRQRLYRNIAHGTAASALLYRFGRRTSFHTGG